LMAFLPLFNFNPMRVGTMRIDKSEKKKFC